MSAADELVLEVNNSGAWKRMLAVSPKARRAVELAAATLVSASILGSGQRRAGVTFRLRSTGPSGRVVSHCTWREDTQSTEWRAPARGEGVL